MPFSQKFLLPLFLLWCSMPATSFSQNNKLANCKALLEEGTLLEILEKPEICAFKGGASEGPEAIYRQVNCSTVLANNEARAVVDKKIDLIEAELDNSGMQKFCGDHKKYYDDNLNALTR